MKRPIITYLRSLVLIYKGITEFFVSIKKRNIFIICLIANNIYCNIKSLSINVVPICTKKNDKLNIPKGTIFT